jgi:putative transposase
LRAGAKREPVLAAWGFTVGRVLLHLMAGSKEDAETVTAFFEGMKGRGLNDPLLVASDGAPGIIKAIEVCFPRAARMREYEIAYLFVDGRNLVVKLPEDVWPEFKVRVQAAYQAPSRAIARDLAAGVVADYGGKHDSAVACFLDDFEACITHLRLPVTHRRATRTTNLLERLFVEERRRLKIIPNAFGERAVLKLMFGALIRAAERWKSIKVTEFERRQLAAVKKELDQEYEAQVHLNRKSSKGAAQTKISSSSQT